MSQHRRIKKRSLTSLEASRGANNPSYGKWKPEEEAFAARLISAFNKGELTDCVEGTSLRSYLAKRLNCIPMRISKKFAGLQIGKNIYVANGRSSETSGNIVEHIQSTRLITEESPRKVTKVSEDHQIVRTSTRCRPATKYNYEEMDSETEEMESDSEQELSIKDEDGDEAFQPITLKASHKRSAPVLLTPKAVKPIASKTSLLTQPAQLETQSPSGVNQLEFSKKVLIRSPAGRQKTIPKIQVVDALSTKHSAFKPVLTQSASSFSEFAPISYHPLTLQMSEEDDVDESMESEHFSLFDFPREHIPRTPPVWNDDHIDLINEAYNSPVSSHAEESIGEWRDLLLCLFSPPEQQEVDKKPAPVRPINNARVRSTTPKKSTLVFADEILPDVSEVFGLTRSFTPMAPVDLQLVRSIQSVLVNREAEQMALLARMELLVAHYPALWVNQSCLPSVPDQLLVNHQYDELMSAQSPTTLATADCLVSDPTSCGLLLSDPSKVTPCDIFSAKQYAHTLQQSRHLLSSSQLAWSELEQQEAMDVYETLSSDECDY